MLPECGSPVASSGYPPRFHLFPGDLFRSRSVVTETDGVFEVGWRHQLFGNTAGDECAAIEHRLMHAETLAYVRRPVGKTSAPLFSYFALARRKWQQGEAND